jgi:hypothetical protein
MSDIKADIIQLTNELGINLTSNDSRIIHTQSGEFNISSNGTINIDPAVKLGVTTNDVNITAKNFTINSVDEIINISSNASINFTPGYLSINTKNISEPFGENGNSIEIICGSGSEGENGGQINITGGITHGGDGGDIYIEGGWSSTHTGGSINLSGAAGHAKFGSVNVNVGPLPSDTRPGGRLKVYGGAFQLFVFENVTKRNQRIPIPEKGDMCLVETSAAGDNLIHYYNGSAWKALQPIA